jgi:hypothetical protein
VGEAVERELVDRLRALHDAVDPVPQPVVAAAHAAFEWRNVDAELAALTSDTLPAQAGMRSTGQARLLVFAGPRGGAEVEVVPIGRRHRLVGQLLPIRASEVVVELFDDRRAASTDAVGCFRFEDLPPGPLRLRWTTADGPVVTGWVSI